MTQGLALSTVAAMLEATVPILQQKLHALPAELTVFRPAPGEWCANEVIGHLIETEQRGFAGRIQRILSEERHVCQAWDPDAVAAARRDHERSTQKLLDELAALRAASILLIEQLQPAQLTNVGHHPVVGELSVRDLLHEWMHHDLNHIKQIDSAIQAFIWPHMGNSQRFSLST